MCHLQPSSRYRQPAMIAVAIAWHVAASSASSSASGSNRSRLKPACEHASSMACTVVTKGMATARALPFPGPRALISPAAPVVICKRRQRAVQRLEDPPLVRIREVLEDKAAQPTTEWLVVEDALADGTAHGCKRLGRCRRCGEKADAGARVVLIRDALKEAMVL
eukprot:975906-Prymnesium_polylepis.1